MDEVKQEFINSMMKDKNRVIAEMVQQHHSEKSGDILLTYYDVLYDITDNARGPGGSWEPPIHDISWWRRAKHSTRSHPSIHMCYCSPCRDSFETEFPTDNKIHTVKCPKCGHLVTELFTKEPKD
jgi:hypothetical protein